MTISTKSITAKQKAKIDWLKRLGAVQDPAIPWVLTMKGKTHEVDTDGRIETTEGIIKA